MQLPFQIFPDPLERRIERRREDNSHQSRQHHSGKGRDSDRPPAAGTGSGCNHQREDAEQKTPGRHQHRAVTEIRSVQRRFKHTLSALPLLLGELHHQNGVFRGKTDQHHHSELRINTQGFSGNQKTEQRPQKRKGDREHHGNRNRPALILRNQEKIGEQQSQRHQIDNLSLILLFLIAQPGPFHMIIIRQF